LVVSTRPFRIFSGEYIGKRKTFVLILALDAGLKMLQYLKVTDIAVKKFNIYFALVAKEQADFTKTSDESEINLKGYIHHFLSEKMQVRIKCLF
jgi:hypothetical protein